MQVQQQKNTYDPHVVDNCCSERLEKKAVTDDNRTKFKMCQDNL